MGSDPCPVCKGTGWQGGVWDRVRGVFTQSMGACEVCYVPPDPAEVRRARERASADREALEEQITAYRNEHRKLRYERD